MKDGYELDDKDMVTYLSSNNPNDLTAEQIYKELGCEDLE